jgi:hypothetical protein
MKRSNIDRIISYIGLVSAAVLLAASVVLYGTYLFIHNEVSAQLEPQNIVLPAEGSAAFVALPEADQDAIRPFAGEQVTTGQQAKIFADNYIGAHLEHIGGGKSYSELSAESMANPNDTALAAKVNTVFKGETLRGILLNAYAFDTMATVAKFVAAGALVAGVVLIGLSVLGFRHAKKAASPKRKK